MDNPLTGELHGRGPAPTRRQGTVASGIAARLATEKGELRIRLEADGFFVVSLRGAAALTGNVNTGRIDRRVRSHHKAAPRRAKAA